MHAITALYARFARSTGLISLNPGITGSVYLNQSQIKTTGECNEKNSVGVGFVVRVRRRLAR